MQKRSLEKKLVAGLALMMALAARAAPVVQTTALNFDDNLMPAGWSAFTNHGVPGSNVQIANGRLEIGQVDTYGGIATQLNTAGLTGIEVTYHGSISDVYWGEDTAIMVMKTIAGGSFYQDDGYVQAAGGKYGFGAQNDWFNIGYVPVDGGAYTSVGTGLLPPHYGIFSYTVKLSNGMASERVLDPDGNLVWDSGNVALNGFLLSDMPWLALWGVTTTGVPATLDDVLIKLTYEDAQAIPAPGTLALAALGLALLTLRRRAGRA